MSRKDHVELEWDVNSSLLCLQSLNNSIRQGKNSEQNLKKLRVVCESFYKKSTKQEYISALDSLGISLLETQVNELADLISFLEASVGTNKRHVVPLKICLLMIIRYITCKTNHTRNVAFIVNATKLAIETAITCYDDEQWQGMQFCLNMADYYGDVIFHWSQIAKLEPEIRSTVIFNTQLLYLAHILWFYAPGNHYEILRFISNEKTYSMGLTGAQKDTISNICFNIGLHYFKTKLYEEATIWLKYSYTLGPSLQETESYRSNKTVSLVLLAACYFNINSSENSRRIESLLNRSGAKATLKELVFSTMLKTKSQDSLLLSDTLDYLATALKKSIRHFHQGVQMVFDALEDNLRFDVINSILNLIPWNTSEKRRFPSNCFGSLNSEIIAEIRWTCARVAVACFLNSQSFNSCYQLLTDLAKWQPNHKRDDPELIQEILALAENHALALCAENQFERAVNWYFVIAKITYRHGLSIPAVLSNGIRCCLQVSQPSKAVSKSLQFFLSCSINTDADCQLLYWKLLIAISEGDHLKAIETSLKLDAIHKADNANSPVSKRDDWKIAVNILEKSIMLALKKNMGDVAIHGLNAIMHKCNQVAAFQPDVYTRALRIHLIVLFRFGSHSEIVETKCIDNLISALISSYLHLKELPDAEYESHLKSTDSGRLELEFANIAWNLGHVVTRSSPFYRHQLFKVSYKLYSLTFQGPQVNEKMARSILLSVAAAINTKSFEQDQPYSEILTRSLDLVEEFFGKFPNSPHKNLIRLYEFYIMCELGLLKRAESLIQIYISEPSISSKARCSFFEGLAALASFSHEKFLLQILPTIEARQFRIENHNQRPIHWQLKLTPMAIQCLQAANATLNNQQNASLIPRISNNWLKITSLASEHALMQEDLRATYFTCCQEYVNFITLHIEQMNSSTLVPFLAQIWNTHISLAIYHKNGKIEAERWYQLAQKLLALSPELTLPNEGEVKLDFRIF